MSAHEGSVSSVPNDTSPGSSSAKPSLPAMNDPAHDATKDTQAALNHSMKSPNEVEETSADESAVFEAFDGHDWLQDQRFLTVLRALQTKGHFRPQEDPTATSELLFNTRRWYADRFLHKAIPSWDRYRVWAESTSSDASLASSTSPKTEPLSTQTALDRALLDYLDEQRRPAPVAWQSAAPKAPLYVRLPPGTAAPGGNDDDDDDDEAATKDEKPAYPARFAELLDCIQNGTPIPGIQTIANTIARDESVRPIGTATPPPKPWQKNRQGQAAPASLAALLGVGSPQAKSSEAAPQDDGADPRDALAIRLDQVFPPVLDTLQSSAAAEEDPTTQTASARSASTSTQLAPLQPESTPSEFPESESTKSTTSSETTTPSETLEHS